jgi:hypothetical protein
MADDDAPRLGRGAVHHRLRGLQGGQPRLYRRQRADLYGVGPLFGPADGRLAPVGLGAPGRLLWHSLGQLCRVAAGRGGHDRRDAGRLLPGRAARRPPAPDLRPDLAARDGGVGHPLEAARPGGVRLCGDGRRAALGVAG